MLPDSNAQKADEKEIKTEAQKVEDVKAPEKQEGEVWKDGKPFNPEWAAKKIEELTNENKVLKPKAKRAEELEAEAKKRADAELSETERLKKEYEEIKAEYTKTKADLWRSEAATAAGIPKMADRLKGETKDEMLADAQELAKSLPQLKVAPKLQPTNPGNTQTVSSEAQLRQLLSGNAVSVFDVNHIRANGGGVLDWTKKDE